MKSKLVVFPRLIVAMLFLAIFGPLPGFGATLNVPEGGDFQAALNTAQPGDVIILQSNATYAGNFLLPDKPGNEYITIQSSALDRLPGTGHRVKPAHARHMPKLVAFDNISVITADKGAHHYRFIGIEACPPAGVNLDTIIRIGIGNEDSLKKLPHDFIFDRVYVHGDPKSGTKRGIGLNGASITVQNSYISDIKRVGQDTQAIGGWNGPGPFRILNNYLEAAGENVMFGGALSPIENLVPSDIEIRRNHFFKPPAWRTGDPAYAGTPWSVKNLFELKNARRVVVDGNIFENNWAHAQSGFAILFTPRTEDGACPWMVVEDIIFTRNIIKNVSAGVNIMGIEDQGRFKSGFGRRILIKDNLFEDVNDPQNGRLFQILGGADSITIDHNTGFQSGSFIVADGLPSPNFVFRNNIVNHGQYGAFGSGKGTGKPCLDYYFPGSVFTKNVLVGGKQALYPAGNFHPSSLKDVGFVDSAMKQYRLRPDSPYRNLGTDGKDPGADIEAVRKATAGVIEGRPTASPGNQQ